MGQGPAKSIEQIDLSLNHPRFTNAKFIVNEKQRNMETVMGVDNKEYQKWRDRLKKEAPSPEYLLLPVKEQFSSKGLCGSSGSLTLDFQDFPYLLTQQMAHRKGKKRLFQQNQLWYLLFALIGAKKDMKPSFSKIGDVRPHNIFINDQGQVKVANTYSWPRQSTNFTKSFENQVTYLAPQQVKQLQMGLVQNDKNDQSELFSIGLTLLSAATLQDFTDAYDLKKHTLNSNRITQKLNQFKINRAYSDIMKGVICNLCSFDQNRRVTPQQLWTWIAPHEQKIKSRQNFYIPSAPQKIHHQVAQVRQSISTLSGSHHGSSSYYPQSHLQSHLPSHQHPDSYVQSSGTRQSSFNNAPKLNFPPPIVRTSNPELSHQNYVNIPNSTQAQSLYIPGTSLNSQQQLGVQGGQTGQGGQSQTQIQQIQTQQGITGNPSTISSTTSTYQYGTGTAQFGNTGTSTGSTGTAQFGSTKITGTTSGNTSAPYGNLPVSTTIGSGAGSTNTKISDNNNNISSTQAINSDTKKQISSTNTYTTNTNTNTNTNKVGEVTPPK